MARTITACTDLDAYSTPTGGTPFANENADRHAANQWKNQPLKILRLADGKPRMVATRTNPVAIQRIVVEEFKSLKIDEQGGITFGLFVGDTPSLNELKPKVITGEKWNIDFLHVEITGTTLEEYP